MSNYSQITLFTPKDALVSGNPLKLVRGSEIDAELAAISVAIATKLDAGSYAGANPSASVGLAAVNGAATTYMRSDAAPALSQAITPTWTGAHTFTNTVTMPAQVNFSTGNAGFMELVNRSAGALGFKFYHGASGSAPVTSFGATGSIFMQGATGGDQGAGTVNATALYDDGVQITNQSGANPTASIGLTAVNGSAGTFLRSDGAPALSQAIAPTWTGQHVWSLALQGPAGSAGTPSHSFSGNPSSGLYLVASNQLGLAANGNRVMHIVAASISGMTVRFDSGQVGAQDGSASAPSYSFVSDPSSGLLLLASGQLAFSESGTAYRVGYRSIPRSTTATTFAIGDVGKCVAVTAAINIPASVFAAGDAISVYNDSGSAVNITISAGTLRLAGTTSTGTRSLAARGIATLWFNSGGATPEVIASGNVT